MKKVIRKSGFAVALGSLACGLIFNDTALAADRNINPAQAASETTFNAVSDLGHAPLWPQKAAAGDEGGIAGPPAPIVWDNGPLDTLEPSPECLAGSTRSTLQNQTICLNTFGSNATNEPAVATVFRMADDFTLSACTDLQTIEFFLYETSATPLTAPSITNMNVSLYGAQPAAATDVPLQTAAGGTANLTTIFRKTEAASGVVVPNCQRRVQRFVVDVSAWPDLAAGTYWLSWNATGSAATTGPWQPPVTILGQFGKPGGNALQAAGAAAAFVAVVDIGGNPGPAGTITCAAGALVPPAPGAAQDLPFIVRGNSCGGNPCPANIVTSGSSATNVDIDDLLFLLSAWGPCPSPPTPCPANIVTSGSSATNVDIDDLLFMLSGWGPC